MLNKFLRTMRASLIRDALQAEGGNLTRAATRLGVQRGTLKYMLGADEADDAVLRWYADLRRDAKEARIQAEIKELTKGAI